ncbi:MULTISPECIES: efflux RND transporter periplasmic adaptor subunit [unclassified Nitrobacter]|uniref:efflux RND transporter periplasmic adaptor subunit n=1 Tax=unclassified Nitrobacter TaxID=2620411 RepID=UPI000926E3CD|nr:MULTISPECIES: efflux RND transporter periplasmic adaptor subunit [unclassified Nitrobacter]MBN9146910.1 efflux RND transporter periplasmic adaptor subunit [Nitrobacter sp.]OJU99837.1 MAG: efflux transporter periplasmic adaptor subunit [Nitrobacter sp. 62-23]
MTVTREGSASDKARVSTQDLDEKSRARPIRLKRWFIIIGLLLTLLVGALVGFNAFRAQKIKEFFASNKPPPVTISAVEAKSEVLPNLQRAVGSLAAVHQVNVTSDVSGRITDILFTAGSRVTKGTPLVQLFDQPDQGDLANYKAQATVARLALERAQQLAARQVGPQVTVDQAQAAFDQANAGIAKTEAIISQKLVRAPFDGVLGVRQVEVGQFLTAGTQIVSLTDLSTLFANFTVTEKDSGRLKVGQTARVSVDAYPGKQFDGKITTIEPQIATDTRNIRVQATINNPGDILKPGMFAEVTVVLPDKPAVVTVPETAVEYSLYGDSVFLIKEHKDDDGKTSLTAEQTFVRTGDRINGRAVIEKGLKPGDKVAAVGQLKLQSGAAVEISKDPLPPIPEKPPLN